MTDDQDDLYFFTQDELLAAMQDDLGFTPEQIESNRQFNDGQLFLSEAVRERLLDAFDLGETVDKVTGELITPQVTRDLDMLKDGTKDLFDKAASVFKDYRSDPVQRDAMLDLCHYVRARLEMIKLEITESAAEDQDDLF